MSRFKCSVLLSGIAAASLAAVAAGAQDGQSEATPRGPLAFEALDADDDGNVTREEFDAHMEAMPGERPRDDRTRPMGQWSEGTRWRDDGRAMEGSPGRMSGRDGRRGSMGWMMGRDDGWGRSGDGRGAYMDQMMGGDWPMRGGMFGMGREMSPEAREAMVDAFIERWDANDDGQLTREEILDGMNEMQAMHQRMWELRDDPAGRARFMFEQMDEDGDGMISQEEAEAAHGRFQRMWGGGRLDDDAPDERSEETEDESGESSDQ